VSLKSRLRRLEAQATALPSPEWAACEFLYQHLSLRQQRLLLEVLEATTEHRPLPYGLAPAEMERVFEEGVTLGERRARIDDLVRRLDAVAPPEEPPLVLSQAPTSLNGGGADQPPADERPVVGPDVKPPERKPPAVMPLRLPPPIRPRNPDVFGVPERFWKRF
jgi:hypothetical protein